MALFRSLSADSVETVESVLPDAFPYGEGWYFSEVFGAVYPVPDTDWVIHRELGLMQIREAEGGGFHLYQLGVGWLWTRSDLFPYFYRFNIESWGFWQEESRDPVYYYFFSYDQWVSVNLERPIPEFPYFFPEDAENDILPEVVAGPPALGLEGPTSLEPDTTGVFTIAGAEPAEVEGIVYWGDGSFSEFTEVPQSFEVSYSNPATYTITVLHLGGEPQSVESTVEVEEAAPPAEIQSIDLEYDFGSGPSGARTTALIGGSAVQPDIVATITYSASEALTANLSLSVTDPDGVITELLIEPVSFSATGGGGGTSTATATVSPALPTSTEGIHSLAAETDQAFAPNVPADSTPLTYYANEVPDLTKECEELRLTLLQAEAELAQKEIDLENLLAALAQLQGQLAAKQAECEELEGVVEDREAEKDAADAAHQQAIDRFKSNYPDWEVAIAGEGESLDAAQAAIEDSLYPTLADDPGAQLPTYVAKGSGRSIGAFPTDSGYWRDIGLFEYDRDPSPLNYERGIRVNKTVLRAFWNRLNAIADTKKDVEAAKDALEAAEAAKAKCDGEVADLEAAIADLENQIAACEAEIEEQQEDIEALLVSAGECEAELRALQELERENRRALRELERELERLRKAREQAKRAAENTDDRIDDKAGDPDDLDADEAEIDDAQDELDDAEDDLDDAQQSANGAQAAAASGNPTQAKQLIQQAKQQASNARQKIDNANATNSRVRARTNARPRRQCMDGDVKEGNWIGPRFVATRVLDIGVCPQGQTPEEWASKKEQGQEVLDSIFTVLWVADAIQDPAGTVKDEITGQIKGEVKDALGGEDIVLSYDMELMANLIYNAFLNLFEATSLLEIHVRLEGYRYETRRNQICVDGRWVLQPEERRIVDDPYYKTKILGPVASGPPEERQEFIANLISRYLKQLGLEAPE